MFAILQDFRIALRRLLKSPGFTALGVLAMALGIGVNTAIYSIADVALFRPIPLKHLHELVAIIGGDEYESLSPLDLATFQDNTETLTHVTGFHSNSYNLTGTGRPIRIRGYHVSANFFEALGEGPSLGRTFLQDEEMRGERVVVLSHALWSTAFAGDPALIGTSVQLDGQSFKVIGIMPPKVRFPTGVDLWTPLNLTPEERQAGNSRFLGLIGRLHPEHHPSAANAEIQTLAASLSREHPDTHTNRPTLAKPLRDHLLGRYGSFFVQLLIGTATLVLLIASANVAILQYARMTSRGREIAVERALGAGQGPILRKVWAESLLLSVGGAVLGVAVALGGLRLLQFTLPADLLQYLPNWERLGLNAHTLVYTAIVTLVAGLVAGTMPALLGTRIDLRETLNETGRGGLTRSLRHHRLKRALVILQVAMALVLLAGAGVMIRGFDNLTQPAGSLQPDQVLTFRVALPELDYGDAVSKTTFQSGLIEELRRVSGSDRIGTVRYLPYSGSRTSSSYAIEGLPDPPFGEGRRAQRQTVGGQYFSTMHLSLLEGRLFNASDVERARDVAVVSKSFVQRFLHGREPLGTRIKRGSLDSERPWLTIGGVIDDIKHDLFDLGAKPTVYQPFNQRPLTHFSVVVRSSRDPMSLIPATRRAVQNLDPALALYQVFSLREVVDHSGYGVQLAGFLMTLLGGLALLLSAIGIYSMMAFAVSERVPEIGIRVVLGARRSVLLRKFLRSGAWMTLLGIAFGILPAWGLVAAISSMTNEIFPADLPAVVGVLLLLVSVSLLASFLPAHRATRINPVEALRGS